MLSILQEIYDVNARIDLACSGATAGFNNQTYRHEPRKWLGYQAQQVVAEYPTIPSNEPVLISITIGANDFAFSDPWTFVLLWSGTDKASDRNFEREIKRRNGLASAGLESSIMSLLRDRPNVKIVLTELYNPFNKESVFFSNNSPYGRAFQCGKCFERSEKTVNLWNATMLDIANRYPGQVFVTEGMRIAFNDHRSPGGKTRFGNASRAGGGCGYTSPNPGSTWVQYRNDPDSYSYPFSSPRTFAARLLGFGESPVSDTEGFHFPIDGWRGDCFHPNQEGAIAIAGFVVSTAEPLLQMK